MSGDDEIVQHISSMDKPGPQKSKEDIIFPCNNYKRSYMHTRKEENQI